MLELTATGWAHTAFSLVSLASGIWLIARHGEIRPDLPLGRLFLGATALTALAALRGQVAAKDKQIEALTAGQFDPAKHIPLVEHQKVAEQLAQLTAQSDKAQHDQLMTAALADARILPANEAYWRGQPLAALQAFLKDAKPIAALGTLQTGGTPPVDTEVAQLTAEESTVCKMLGITAEDFLKSKAA